ncbi:serine/threonine-protein phosphatase 6 regulatory ankyrin repeat subunit A-like isoform X1 [Schistocerca americana]|uniref:serine/threonine-protein phosphatase 6 regulatory ankyrin repeat subunit A-like isoform X1 n=2 Tax=Schistocerca americana TaxID=7009 RepID=UPI001F5034F7|nr:serine/threonine-protein phosphatase 6 regulatory ankyrin repeat subunit A-like isoform X1 [Schistocerca americana]XP_049950550.1 serine/threonine-protein phosphatase 6 regulatory ankyrin repeat subunit A-like isoform X3 [Schistocerca serialis cubense]
MSSRRRNVGTRSFLTMERIEDMLFSAISKGDVHNVGYLLSKGANMNVICGQGRTSLGLAAELGNTAVLQKLLDFSNAPAIYSRERDNRKRRAKKWKRDPELGGTPVNQNHTAAAQTSTSNQAEVRTPEGMDALEWDPEMSATAPGPPDKDEEHWSRLYMWYAGILDRTSTMYDIPHSCDVNHQDYYSRCALHYAAEQGHEDAVLLLTAAGCRVDIGDKENRTPLHLAASRGHSAVAVHLLDSGAEVNRKTSDRTSALHIAASRGFTNFVRVLLEHGANVDALDASDRTPLMLAVLRRRDQVVRVLVEHGAKVNIEEIHGYTPLCEAVWQKSVPMVKILLDAGAKVTQSHYLLHYAIMHRQVDMARLLLQAGCIVNLRDDNGDTPLIAAARTGNCEITELLLKNGANVNYSNGLTGSGPLHESVEYTRDSDFQTFVEMVKVLRSHGAILNAHSLTGGDTPLFRAILLQKYKAAALLIRLGSDVNMCDVNICGVDLVTLARKRNHFGLIRMLIYAGFNLHQNFPEIEPPNNPDALDLDSIDGWMKYMKYNPMRLTDLCRIVLRKQMGERVSEVVSKSFLPQILKSYMMLEDVLT